MYDPQWQVQPSAQVTTELVGSLIRQRRQELAEQIAVGTVNLHEIEAGLLSSLSCFRERLSDLCDLGLRRSLCQLASTRN